MALIALGVTGGIGAYKAVEVARGLQKQGHDVVAIMTRTARRFVAPLTFEAITRHEVITSQWKPGANADIEHIAIASTADVLLVAPATANTIGKFAHGIADDFLSSLYLATRAPVVMAPAMNTNMFEHPVVKENMRVLAARGVRFIEPGAGYLACGWIGKGRLAEPEDVVAYVQQMLRPTGALSGRRVLVTAGPTYEDLDPVRFIGNRSSGRMGYAVAAEATARGAVVTLISGPTRIDTPNVAELVRVRTAAEMHAAVTQHVPGADIVVMAAAVADYTPERVADRKIAKEDGPLTVTLTRTKDILGELGAEPSRAAGQGPLLVGFAAETHDVLSHARAKLARKAVDLIVANDVSQPDRGFDVDTNAVTLLTADETEDVAVASKATVAGRILDRVERLLEARSRASHPA